MRLRAFQGLLHQPRRLSPRHCEATGCSHATREGKAYCSDHVEMHPYVQDLITRLEQREEEDERVNKRGPRAVNLQGITTQEILQHLAFHGPRTEERLCRELNLDVKTLQGYVQALRRKKLVTLGHTKRGSTVVKLTKAMVRAAQPIPSEEIEDEAEEALEATA
jgi:predicted transcriptional regulator